MRNGIYAWSIAQVNIAQVDSVFASGLRFVKALLDDKLQVFFICMSITDVLDKGVDQDNNVSPNRI